jgi:hypothetical protein
MCTVVHIFGFEGDIMSSHPATFYHYEPLLHFDIRQARGGHLAQVMY